MEEGGRETSPPGINDLLVLFNQIISSTVRKTMELPTPHCVSEDSQE